MTFWEQRAWIQSKLVLAVFFFSFFFLTKDRGCLFKEGCCIEYRKGHFSIFKRSWESLKDEWEQGQLPRRSTPVLIEIWFLKGRLENDVKPTGHYCLHVCVCEWMWVCILQFAATSWMFFMEGCLKFFICWRKSIHRFHLSLYKPSYNQG